MKEDYLTQIVLFCVNQCKFLGLRDCARGHELFSISFKQCRHLTNFCARRKSIFEPEVDFLEKIRKTDHPFNSWSIIVFNDRLNVRAVTSIGSLLTSLLQTGG